MIRELLQQQSIGELRQVSDDELVLENLHPHAVARGLSSCWMGASRQLEEQQERENAEEGHERDLLFSFDRGGFGLPFR